MKQAEGKVPGNRSDRKEMNPEIWGKHWGRQAREMH